MGADSWLQPVQSRRDGLEGNRAHAKLNLVSDHDILYWLGRTLCSLSHLHLKSGYELDPRVGQELLAENDAMVCVFF